MSRPRSPEPPASRGLTAHPPTSTESTAPVKTEEQSSALGLAAPSPNAGPTEAAEQEARAYAERVGQALLKELPEGVTAEPVEDRPRPTVKLTYLRAPRGGETCIVGLGGTSEGVDTQAALAAVRDFWGV